MKLGSGALFLLSLLAALCLQFLPLSPAMSVIWPLWLAMTLGYWSLYGPNVPVTLGAVLLGLAADTLLNAPLGQHVIGFCLMAYTIIRLRTVLGLYASWQVSLLLGPVWLLFAVLMYLLDGMARHPSDALGRFLPVLSSTLLWPLLVLLLDSLRSRREHSL